MMSKRDPYDPDGEYEGRNCTREDCFCSQEGYFMIETQDEPISADITTLGDDTCAGEFKRETVTQQAIALILEREKMGTRTYGKPLFADAKSFIAWADDAIDEAADQLQYLIAMREALATYLDSV